MSDLTDAIQAGDVSRVQALIENDPEVWSRDHGAVTPLMLSVYYGKNDVTRLLLDRGVPVSFAEACAIGDEGRVREMLDRDPSLVNDRTADGHAPLGLSIFFRHPEVARLLIDAGADVHAVSANAQRVAPVHAAAAVCDRATMRLLLDRGADPNAKQQGEFTPLHGAASRGDVEMAELLITHGARVDDAASLAEAARSHGQDAFAEWIASR